MKPERVISGGQTGADQAGLYAARDAGIPTGGIAPLGWKTDAGPAPWLGEFFGLVESTFLGYRVRTITNVWAADATVIFGNLDSPGCRLTVKTAQQKARVTGHVDHMLLLENPDAETLHDWLVEYDVRILNVAGNRERTNPGIFQRVYDLLIAEFLSGTP